MTCMYMYAFMQCIQCSKWNWLLSYCRVHHPLPHPLLYTSSRGNWHHIIAGGDNCLPIITGQACLSALILIAFNTNGSLVQTFINVVWPTHNIYFWGYYILLLQNVHKVVASLQAWAHHAWIDGLGLQLYTGWHSTHPLLISFSMPLH